MAIEFNIKVDGDTIRVKASGFDESYEEVLHYSNSVVGSAIENNSKKIICDERELIYKISTFDIFALAESVSAFAPSIIKGVIVCNPSCITDGKFYETVSQNRGLIVRVTTDLDDAEKWLNN